MDTGAWRATVHGVEKSWTQLSNFHFHKEPWVFPGAADGKESACNVGDLYLIPGLGRSSGEGNGYPLQFSSLENSMDGQRILVGYKHGFAKSQTQLSNKHFNHKGIISSYVRQPRR